MKSKDLLISDVRLFTTAISGGSLAAGAEILSLPRASATRAMQRLEAALGRSLLHRNTGRFVLTEEGRIFLPSAQRMLDSMDQAMAELCLRGGPLKGSLRISAPYKFGCTQIAPCISDFLCLHPDIEITLELGNRRVDLLNDEADLAVRTGAVGGDSLVSRPLAKEQIILCASPSYLTVRGLPELPEDLASHSLLTRGSNGQPPGLTLICRNQTYRIAGNVVLRSNEAEVLMESAIRGVGIAHLPLSSVETEIETGALVAVLPQLDLMPESINAVYAVGRRQSRKVRAFLDFLIDRINPH